VRWSRDFPIRRRLTLITVASAGAALFLACGAFLTYEALTSRGTMVRKITIRAEILGRLSTSALVFHDPESAAVTLRALSADPRVVSARLYTADGTLFASYLRQGAADTPLPRPPAAGDGHTFAEGRVVLFHRFAFDGAPIGMLAIESDLTEMTTRLKRYAAIALLVLLASSVVAYWTASRLQRAITEPVLHLSETAQAVSTRKDYSVRAATRGPGELGLLIHTFNHMLDQIQERDAELQGARDRLELQVGERTLDLTKEIADRKVLEEELRRKNSELQEQSRRVQQATRLKSEFLANMSHELRTPLNAIIGFAELLHDGKVGPVPAPQQECLVDILTSSRHLLQLINDVLDLSKVEAGKMEFRPEAMAVERVVGEVRDILRGLSARKRITITAQVDAGLDEVFLDPGKLKQVLYNYLSNAIKFTPERGNITVRALAEGPDHFRLEVQDTGIGIQPEDLQRLFVEFQQLDSSAAKAHPGTGLGLVLTKRIVEAQGGRVGVRSTPGQGSLFFAVLPRVANKAPAADEVRRPAGQRPGAPTILVIEDEAKEANWLVDMLSAAGYAVEVASTGRQAIDLCRQRSFEGITLDLLLPDMGGWDILKQLRAGGANKATPVIVVTLVAERGAANGFVIHDYLVKPLQEGDLLASLQRAGIEPAGSRTILVVDDDAQARRLMETTLQGLGYRAFTTANAQEGLRIAAAEAPGAVILDLLMPDMDGFEFLDRFKRTPTGQETPVIVWTAKDLTREERTLLQASSQAVVLKSEGGTGQLLRELRNVVPSPPAPTSHDAR
jgi:signal transduction histidine kinase/DNA-binding response OmpR family regulator